MEIAKLSFFNYSPQKEQSHKELIATISIHLPYYVTSQEEYVAMLDCIFAKSRLAWFLEDCFYDERYNTRRVTIQLVDQLISEVKSGWVHFSDEVIHVLYRLLTLFLFNPDREIFAEWHPNGTNTSRIG